MEKYYVRNRRNTYEPTFYTVMVLKISKLRTRVEKSFRFQRFFTLRSNNPNTSLHVRTYVTIANN